MSAVRRSKRRRTCLFENAVLEDEPQTVSADSVGTCSDDTDSVSVDPPSPASTARQPRKTKERRLSAVDDLDETEKISCPTFAEFLSRARVWTLHDHTRLTLRRVSATESRLDDDDSVERGSLSLKNGVLMFSVYTSSLPSMLCLPESQCKSVVFLYKAVRLFVEAPASSQKLTHSLVAICDACQGDGESGRWRAVRDAIFLSVGDRRYASMSGLRKAHGANYGRELRVVVVPVSDEDPVTAQQKYHLFLRDYYECDGIESSPRWFVRSTVEYDAFLSNIFSTLRDADTDCETSHANFVFSRALGMLRSKLRWTADSEMRPADDPDVFAVARGDVPVGFTFTVTATGLKQTENSTEPWFE